MFVEAFKTKLGFISEKWLDLTSLHTDVEIPWVKDHFIVCEFRSLERKQNKFLFGPIAAFTHFVYSYFPDL